jgi:serine/threonine-protein kinase
MKACPQCHIRYPADAVYCFLDGASLVAFRDPLIGTTIAGRYLIEDMLGEGGMATVYRARHKLVDRPCAVKVMNPGLATDPKVRERFRREARSAQSLAHPNVIEIFDQGELPDGTPYIVMELLEGQTLAAVVEKGAIPPPRAVPLMIQISRGIARAHDLGVVHRDLKPENIFVCRRLDGSDLVKILDFGIARSRSDSRLTNAGELFGTPQYLAPERITGGETGPSVDLYALGVIFFEMATGKLPFEANDPPSFLIKHMK